MDLSSHKFKNAFYFSYTIQFYRVNVYLFVRLRIHVRITLGYAGKDIVVVACTSESLGSLGILFPFDPTGNRCFFF